MILFLAMGTVWFFYRPHPLSQPAAEQKSNSLQKIKEAKKTVALIPAVLGFERPQTYLVLFLNNTELRPGGGFIGSYGLAKVNKGEVTLFETNGSENLDWAAPTDFKIEPPAPIKKFLNQDKWYFRDSNWSPDFPAAAKAAIWFYRFEGGKDGERIDGVIGVTPTVVEKLMDLTGPVEVNGRKFEAANFTEELEYHVEYGYKEAGRGLAERKIIIGELGRALLKKLSSLAPWKWGELWAAANDLIKERQMMFYSNNPETQKIFLENDWAGEIKETKGDYLAVVDSNLASLKTDPVIKRRIFYYIVPQVTGYKAEVVGYKAEVRVEYDHQGSFDWKTTRYRTYTRIYVPAGSRLIGAEGFMDEKKNPAEAVVEEELGKISFGGFLSLEPKDRKVLTISYYLPKEIAQNIQKGLYTLFVQKQLGSGRTPLTVYLDFGKKGKDGQPIILRRETDLSVDREFKWQ
ncbi:MAG: DUF4012 domain-containing protein [Candidatus Magasanikbacteria bacterium]|nr:DUF4012 domain-containing protein [Candidatus Magasanikbacteria bacterium]